MGPEEAFIKGLSPFQNVFKELYKALKGLIGPSRDLQGPQGPRKALKGPIRPGPEGRALKGLTRPLEGSYKALKGLIRPLKTL